MGEGTGTRDIEGGLFGLESSGCTEYWDSPARAYWVQLKQIIDLSI